MNDRCSGTLSHQSHRVRITTESLDIVVDPSERHCHVLETIVTGRDGVSGAEETCIKSLLYIIYICTGDHRMDEGASVQELRGSRAHNRI